MAGNVVGYSVVICLGILGSPEFPEANEEKQGPANEKSKHEPVGNIDQMIDAATVLGKILGNPEPF